MKIKTLPLRVRYFFLLLLLPLLASCTPGFFYNNLDRISLWYIDDYISLTSEQRKEYSWRFNDIQQWHRKYELENYRLFLSAISQQIDSQQLSQSDLEQAVTHYHQQAMTLWVNLGRQVYPHLHELTLQLSSQQKQELVNNLLAKNEKHFEKMQSLSDQEKQKRKIAQLEKNLSRWIGSFTDEQEQMTQQWAKNLRPLDQAHFEFRQHWLNELRKTLYLPPEESRIRLEQQLSNREAFMVPEYRQQLEANRRLTEKLIANLLVIRTSKQQKTLAREISDWLNLIDKVSQS